MATKTARSLHVSCPFCAAADSIAIDLNDLDAIQCSSCDETFTARQAADKAAELAAKWSKVAAWVDVAPVA